MYLVPPWGSGQLLLHRFHHGDAVVVKQVQVFVAYSLRGSALYTDYVGPPALLRYLNWTAATNLQQGTCEPGPTALLPMGLAYVTTAYTYGRPMHAQTNNSSTRQFIMTSDSRLPTLTLELATVWALWQVTLTGRLGGLARCLLDDLSGLLAD